MKNIETNWEWYVGIGLGITKIDESWLIILPFIVVLITEVDG